MSDTPERTALYRLYDKLDRLLYVGIAGDPKTRWHRHASDKAWWPEVVTRDVEWFSSRELAAAAEVETITTEKPVHNRTHNYKPSSLLALLPAAAEVTMRPRLQRVEEDERGASQKVAADLRSLIMSGEIPTGSKLPTTAEFMARYRISNVTVQRALSVLKGEGFAIGRNGAGVYTTSPTPKDAGESDGQAVRLLDSDETAAPIEIAGALGCAPGEAIRREQLVVEVGDWPLSIVTFYRRIDSAPFEEYEHFDSLTVRPPTSEELVALNLPDGVAVMRTLRVVRDVTGEPCEVRLIIEPGHLCQRQYTVPAPRST
ncbi:GntR family transcriptional regulator [Streptomyces sp. NPDC005892]|uniref:GntR family transcriptional regulator n=1 Tax=Streptomyces sp. NPDC005892 TaxID=3155593 RepID=UPI0033CA29B2